ncbi:MAG: hypothetical protein IJ088_09590 [Clostridia bacterium]|nr:hypothetical protein [Clostridia bacterium]
MNKDGPTRSIPSKVKQTYESVTDYFSVLLVFLFPIVTGIIFLRLMFMSGTPSWFRVIQGLIFIISLIQAVYFLVFWLTHSKRRKDR